MEFVSCTIDIMKVLKRIFRWTALTVLILVVGGLVIAWFVDSRQSDEELAEEFKSQRIQPTVHYYQLATGMLPALNRMKHPEPFDL